jgi:hypothetical protein
VTAPTDELVALITGQHGRIKTLMTDVTMATDVDRLAAFDGFRRYLAIHEAAEQALLHPQGLVAFDDDNVSQRRITEEQDAAAVIASLESMRNPADFKVQFGLLQEAVIRHAEAEEHEELPRLVAALPEDTIEKVLEGFALVEPWADDVAASPIKGATTFEEMVSQAMVAFAASEKETR